MCKKLCPFLVHDLRGFSIDEDVPRTRKTIVELAKKVDVDEVVADHVEALLNSHKEQLSTEDSLHLRERTSVGGEERRSKLVQEDLALLNVDDPKS
jgi:hypothetical protein